MDHTMFTYEAREQTLVIHLPKELDHHNCRNLKSDTDLLLEENYINRIVFDFTHTSFMDSSGIGLVMGRFRLMQENDGKVVLQNLPAPIRKVMKLAGLDKLAEFH